MVGIGLAAILGNRVAGGRFNPLDDLVGTNVDATAAARRGRVVDSARDRADDDRAALGVEVDRTTAVTEAGVGGAGATGDELAARGDVLVAAVAGRAHRPATGGCAHRRAARRHRPTSSTSTRSTPAMYAFRRDLLGPALRRVSPTTPRASTTSPTSSSVLAGDGPPGRRRCRPPAEETQGVNDRWQLALAERELRGRTNRHWLLNGVTMLDPRQTFIDVTVELGRDITLYPGTILQGATVDRRRQRDRPRHPPRRLRRRRAGAVVEHTVGHATPRSATAPRSVRSPTCRRALDVACGRRDGRRSTLRADGLTTGGRTPMEKVTTKKLALYSGRTHPALAEEVADHLGVDARATPTSSSSPTASCGRASPRASAAATCSSCRATTASTGAPSTTRSWSS